MEMALEIYKYTHSTGIDAYFGDIIQEHVLISELYNVETDYQKTRHFDLDRQLVGINVFPNCMDGISQLSI